MISDHELLLAAKAANIEVLRRNDMLSCYETSEGLWNPRSSLGDALALACKLDISINFGTYKVVVESVPQEFGKVVCYALPPLQRQ